MDFSFSDEQSMLQDSVQRFIQNDYSFEHRQKLIASDEGFSRDNWAAFAELGWLALPFSEADGGFGGTAVETMILMEEFGKGLILEPYLSSIVMSASLIARAGTDEQKENWLQPILQGEKLAALAFIEPQARFNLADVKTAAVSCEGGFCINGFKGVVLGGPSADFFIVPARTSGSQTDEQGISLFLVDAQSEGVHRRNYPTIDGFRASEVTFKDVEVASDAVLGEIGGGLESLQVVG